MKQYQVIGPDGVADRPEPYNTREEAERAIEEFCARYDTAHLGGTGCYRTSDGVNIPWNDLNKYCEITEFNDIVISLEERCLLAKEVYRVVYANTHSFHLADCIGGELAYLLGAIVDEDENGVDWSHYNVHCNPILRLFEKHFPTDHKVWQFITK